MADYRHLLGQRFVAATKLSPAGKIRVGSQLIDCVADAEIVPEGTTVVVAKVQGHRVVVQTEGQVSRGAG